MTMQKGFGLIGILIVVALVAGIGAFMFDSLFPDKSPFTPSEEEKSAIDMAEEMKGVLEGKSEETTAVTDEVMQGESVDWKTYRNEEYGFEFKYPKDWSTTEKKLSNDHPDSYLKVRIFISNSPVIENQKLSKENIDTISGFDVTFRGSQNKPQLDIEKWYEVSEGGNEIISKKITTIGSRKAICTETSWRDFIVRRCFVSSGTSIIEIGYSPSQSKFIKDYEDILSTFKFLP